MVSRTYQVYGFKSEPATHTEGMNECKTVEEKQKQKIGKTANGTAQPIKTHRRFWTARKLRTHSDFNRSAVRSRKQRHIHMQPSDTRSMRNNLISTSTHTDTHAHMHGHP